MAHSVLPGLVLALVLGWIKPWWTDQWSDRALPERLNQRFAGGREPRTVLAGFTALGVLLVPLLQVRVDLESLLFGDILAAGGPDLIRTAIAALHCCCC